MAELATIARPYAEALFKAIGQADAQAVSQQVNALAAVAADAQLLQFADNPKVTSAQVFDLIISAVPGFVGDGAKNLLRAVIDNGRLAALPAIASQFHTLVSSRTGVSDAVVESAFAIDAAQLADVKAALEKRFGRKLNTSVAIRPELIGGIRVVVGDEVLDTSVRARLEQMKTALVA